MITGQNRAHLLLQELDELDDAGVEIEHFGYKEKGLVGLILFLLGDLVLVFFGVSITNARSIKSLLMNKANLSS